MNKIFLTLLGLAVLVMASSEARAAKYECAVSSFKVFSASPVNGSTAHLVEVPTSANCPSICTLAGYPRLYIDYADRDIYAFMMAASLKGGTFVVQYETAAPIRGSVFHGSFSCRIEGFRQA